MPLRAINALQLTSTKHYQSNERRALVCLPGAAQILSFLYSFS